MTGSIQAFGPPTLPMCPTLVNRQSAFCQRAISDASAARLIGTRCAPASPHDVEDRRRLAAVQRRPENAQVLRIQALLTRDIRDALRARGQGLALADRGGQVFFQRQPASVVGAEDDALQIDLRAAARVGKPTVEAPDSRQHLVGPVPPGGARRKPDAVGQEHGMVGDLLAGVEVLREQGRRHHERIAGVGKTLAGGAIDGKLAGGLQIDARQIEQRVRVLGVAEPAQHDRPGIAGAGERLGLQVVGNPAPQPLPALGRRLGSFLRRHLAVVEHLGDLEPRLGRAPHVVERRELLEVERPFLHVGRVTLHAMLVQDRADLAPELLPSF